MIKWGYLTAIAGKIDERRDTMYRHCICIVVLILLSLPLLSQQDTGDSAPSPGETFQDCDECPKMVVVPPGSFTMGSPARERGPSDERPLHRGAYRLPVCGGSI